MSGERSPNLIYNSGGFAVATFTAAAVKQALARDANRAYLAIQVLTAFAGRTIKIAFGSEAGPNNGWTVVPGAPPLIFSNPESCPKQYLSIYCDGAANVEILSISQGTQFV